MKQIPLFLAGALLFASLMGGCAMADPAQSGNPFMESRIQNGGEMNELTDSPAAEDADGNPPARDNPYWDVELWSNLWQYLPYHDRGDNLAAVRHCGGQMDWTDLDRAGEWELYNYSNEGPYYVVIPKYKRSTLILETIQNQYGDFIATGEVFRKDNVPDGYALAISYPLSEGADSLRVTVEYENRTASFDFFYAAAIDPFPYMDNGILHIQPTSGAFGGGGATQAGDPDVFGQTNEFGGGSTPQTGDPDVFGQTNEFGGGSTPQTGDPDVFGQTNEFGGSVPNGDYKFDTDIFGQTNEFGAAGSQQPGNAATTKTLYTRYATEGDLPAATREEQRLIDTYLAPYSASGLYQTNFTPDYMNEMSSFTLTIMFDSLCHQFGGYPSGADILPGGRVAGEVFEGKLMKHLPLTAQMIRKICGSYDPADGTYELSPGIGSAPTYYVITEYVELDTALRISYAHYGIGVDETYTFATNTTHTEEYIKLYGTGIAVINRTDEAYAILGNIYQEV